jgi:5S rRNA maturation endonuclease (ribonuclease M5)
MPANDASGLESPTVHSLKSQPSLEIGKVEPIVIRPPNPIKIRLFVSMPFDSSLGELYNYGIKQAANYINEGGEYEIIVFRADDHHWRDLRLDENLFRQIDNSDIVIADASSQVETKVANPNVMLEIGYSRGRKTPVILITRYDVILPVNLSGLLVVKYNNLIEGGYEEFSRELARRIIDIIVSHKLPKKRGEFSVEGFFSRSAIKLDELIERARKRVFILTTNLDYTCNHLRKAIRKALDNNSSNTDFKVEILTMDPESSVVNERAVQLGKIPRKYRDQLRQSLEGIQREFERDEKIEIIPYSSFPTQMTFIIDNRVVLAVVSMQQARRESSHFLIEGEGVEPFLTHFSAVRARARTPS